MVAKFGQSDAEQRTGGSFFRMATAVLHRL